MRILIVSHSFPPYTSIGTLRVGKTAKYLVRLGHEVRVLTAAPQFMQRSLAVEVPAEWVHATPWVNLHAPAERVGGGVEAGLHRGDIPQSTLWRVLRSSAWRVYRETLGYPDFQIGWLPWAVREGRRIISSWRPDIIFASAPPYSTLLVARALSRGSGIPWVAELRDLWTDTHHYPHSRLRRVLERRTERGVLTTASGLVTVSEPLAAQLRSRFDVPVRVVTNAFDAEDLPRRQVTEEDATTLRIVYTGSVQSPQQSPRMLFEALARSPDLRDRVRVDFYGYRLSSLVDLVRELGLADRVGIHAPVPYATSLQLQRDADVLLLLLWQDPAQTGILTGKLFEYLGARRPILAVGSERDLAARMVEERGAGAGARSADAVERALRGWLQEKADGGVPDLAIAATEGLTREEQTRHLADFLRETLDA